MDEHFSEVAHIFPDHPLSIFLPSHSHGWTAEEPHLGTVVFEIPTFATFHCGKRVSKHKCVLVGALLAQAISAQTSGCPVAAQETVLSRAWRAILMGQRPPSVRWPRSWEQRGRIHSKTPQHSVPKSTNTRVTDPSQGLGASTLRQSGRPRSGSTCTSDSSPACRGFVGGGQHPMWPV